MPTLAKFTGFDDEKFDWKESTIEMLGTAGFQRFLDDQAVITKHPEIAEKRFLFLARRKAWCTSTVHCAMCVRQEDFRPVRLVVGR